MRGIESAAMTARRLEWQVAEVREIVVETYRVKSLLLGNRLAGAPAWPACGYPAHVRRWLPGAAQLFDRIASRR
jgi:hypothetical protein